MGDKEKQYYPLETIDDIIQGSKAGMGTSTTVRIEDASSKTAEILVPELGSDDEWKREGKIDWRRFGHIDIVDPYWMAHFRLIDKYQGGVYATKFVEEFANLNFSVNGRHKKLTVDMQKAVSGKQSQDKSPKKKRGIMDKLLGRNKDTEEE